MMALDHIHEVKFNHTELVSILAEDQTFNHHRAGRWIDDNPALALQAIIMYLTAIFSIKMWMRNRKPYDLKMPLAIWNFTIANFSGLCSLAMFYEYFATMYYKGVNESVCNTRDEFYGGRIGYTVFVMVLARSAEFIDTFFIVLRKKNLMFMHWYHHTTGLLISWATYSTFFPAGVHLAFVNANIHLATYSYFFLTSLNFRPPKFIGQSILLLEIAQFFMCLYGLCYILLTHFVLDV
ncbi:hypothetical protein PENTCL1PPCAC_12327, partial [Pristionchus entomophagus]